MTPATPAEVAAALEASAELGGFFGWQSPRQEEETWSPLSLLYQPAPGPLDGLIDRMSAALGNCERRIAASVFFQDYAAKLLSPQLGGLAASGVIPDLSVSDLSWRAQGSLELGLLSAERGWRGALEELAPVVLAQSFSASLNPLIAAVRARVRLPTAILTDNATSAYVQGLALLGTSPREPFARRSCCLYYKVAGGGYCGDCPIRK